MIVLLDTSTPTCRLTLIRDEERFQIEWEADRTLAKVLLSFLHQQLALHESDWSALSAIGVMRGPGSFTGLRIGLTVMNTLADSLHIPIVGTHGVDWVEQAIAQLQAGQNDKIVMPFYGSEAHITTPRK